MGTHHPVAVTAAAATTRGRWRCRRPGRSRDEKRVLSGLGGSVSGLKRGHSPEDLFYLHELEVSEF